MLELFNIIFDGKFVTLDCKSYDTPKIGVFKVIFNLKEENLVCVLMKACITHLMYFVLEKCPIKL